MIQQPIQTYISDREIFNRAHKSGNIVQEEVLLAMEAGEIPLRYQRNNHALSLTDQISLARSAVLLVGCGGLGGNLCEYLVRMGVGKIVACDPDVFEESNCNRQILATSETLGQSKALAARQRALAINPLVEVVAVEDFVRFDLLDSVQAVADCLGGADYRQELLEMARIADLPLVSAGIAGWHALVCTTWPGESGIGEFMGKAANSVEDEQGVLAPVASFAASLQAGELVRIMTGVSPILRGNLLMADTARMRFSTVDLDIF
ncbi:MULTISPECIES: ThiF family adenylyltransferase [Desulfonatronospira]|nr:MULTISPECIES: ThiF family adenylyltransferase [Desulfonatronospira]RQD73363.1 MAG: thiamine biosynthesis protein ThiF [Desulfonatronospira sp. MSAO_Bac3]